MCAEYLSSDVAVRVLLVLQNTRQLIVEYQDLAEDEVNNERRALHLREGSTVTIDIFELSCGTLQTLYSKTEQKPKIAIAKSIPDAIALSSLDTSLDRHTNTI